MKETKPEKLDPTLWDAIALSLDQIGIINIIHDLPWRKNEVWSSRSEKQIDAIVVHQSLGAMTAKAMNNYHIADAINPKTGMRDIRYGREWPHIAYHFVVEPDGKIFQCNELRHKTWHTKSQNTRGVGVCFAGNFSGPGHTGKNEPTPGQLGAFVQLIPALARLIGKPVAECLFGHFDFGKPACPGDVIRQWVEDARGH
jgi:hypothetical protein